MDFSCFSMVFHGFRTMFGLVLDIWSARVAPSMCFTLAKSCASFSDFVRSLPVSPEHPKKPPESRKKPRFGTASGILRQFYATF